MPLTKEKIFQDIANELDKAKSVLILTHPSPDGDAVGSVLAAYQFLQARGKQVNLYIDDTASNDFNFLAHFDKINNNPQIFFKHPHDVFFILDIGDFARSRAKKYLDQIDYQPLLINIDHHVTNDNFGHHNLVDLNASSVAELIYECMEFHNHQIDSQVATALLTGIITDTDCFINANTSPAALRVSAELIKHGARLNLILDKIYKNSSIKSLRLWGKALARLNVDNKNELATTAVFEDDIEDTRTSDNDLIGLANFLKSLQSAKSVIVLKEDGSNQVKANLRAIYDGVDVSEIAKQYGGGGHTRAAGFITKGRIVKSESGEWKIEKSN